MIWRRLGFIRGGPRIIRTYPRIIQHGQGIVLSCSWNHTKRSRIESRNSQIDSWNAPMHSRNSPIYSPTAPINSWNCSDLAWSEQLGGFSLRIEPRLAFRSFLPLKFHFLPPGRAEQPRPGRVGAVGAESF